jgi:hypothetical protein
MPIAPTITIDMAKPVLSVAFTLNSLRDKRQPARRAFVPFLPTANAPI